MLVLSRRNNEEVLFPELGIKVKVIKTSGNQVRLGIEAPNDIRVIRGELANTKREPTSGTGDRHQSAAAASTVSYTSEDGIISIACAPQN